MDASHKHIVLVEDDELLGDLLLSGLTKAGFVVTLLRDGQQALEYFNGHVPDALLLDLQLPIVNGYEILEFLQKHPDRFAGLPILIISNSGQPVQLSRALALGVKDYVVKADLSVDEVIQKARQLVPVEQTDETRPRVLVIEDDTMLSDLAYMSLSKLFKTTVASTGNQALELIKTTVYDAVLIDIILPDIDGFRIIEEIRKDPRYAHTACLMFSNLGQDSEKERAFNLGADAFYIKANVSIHEISDFIRQHIQKKRAHL